MGFEHFERRGHFGGESIDDSDAPEMVHPPKKFPPLKGSKVPEGGGEPQGKPPYIPGPYIPKLPKPRSLKIVDFDVECRPMAWYGDWVTKEITAIAWRFLDEPENATHSWLLTPSKTFEQHQHKKRVGLLRFLKDFEKADMVTGHFIRGFDLPLINGTCVRLKVSVMKNKLVHDTKNDLIVMQGLSKSQENLGAMLELEHKKIKMDTMKWEVANTLSVEGRKAAKERVVGDVNQHIEFRAELMERGALLPPRLWTPGSKAGRYVG